MLLRHENSTISSNVLIDAIDTVVPWMNSCFASKAEKRAGCIATIRSYIFHTFGRSPKIIEVKDIVE